MAGVPWLEACSTLSLSGMTPISGVRRISWMSSRLSMETPGADVIADGTIHVYAPLRGKAIAGARGKTEARIISLCMEPQLISIAGVYRTSEVPLPADVLSKPTQVRLVGGAEGKLVMDPVKI